MVPQNTMMYDKNHLLVTFYKTRAYLEGHKVLLLCLPESIYMALRIFVARKIYLVICEGIILELVLLAAFSFHRYNINRFATVICSISSALNIPPCLKDKQLYGWGSSVPAVIKQIKISNSKHIKYSFNWNFMCLLTYLTLFYKIKIPN